eukprot:scaffold41759_cov66-Phaeocystis_antarctica.AAC.2
MQRRVHYSLERPVQRQVRWGGQRGWHGELRGRCSGSVSRLGFRVIRGAGGVARVRGRGGPGGGARGGGDVSIGLQLTTQLVRQCCCQMSGCHERGWRHW